MRILLTLFLSLYPLYMNAANVITCGDAMSVGKEAKTSLHSSAQNRAQKAIEYFTGKKLKTPYIDGFGKPGTPETTAAMIEIFWCETSSTPLHSAYYRLYSSNKDYFE